MGHPVYNCPIHYFIKLAGQIDNERAKMNRYRHPWQFSNEELQSHCHLNKENFFDFVYTLRGVVRRRGELNVFGMSLLFLMKINKGTSFQELTTNFALKDKAKAELASKIFKRVLTFHIKYVCNIPAVVDGNGVLNVAERDRLLEHAYRSTQVYYRTLVEDFEDPSGQGRNPVVLMADATYLGKPSKKKHFNIDICQNLE